MNAETPIIPDSDRVSLACRDACLLVKDLRGKVLNDMDSTYLMLAREYINEILED